MAKKDYLRRPEAELVTWFEVFAVKLATYQATFGLTQAEVDGVAADAAAVKFVVNGIDQLTNLVEAFSAFKKRLLKGPKGAAAPNVPAPPTLTLATLPPVAILSRTRELVKRLKAHPGYTDAIGLDLGIVGSEITETQIKPQAKAKPLPGYRAEISFVKRRFDGVNIESQRGGETAWTPIGFDSVSPFVDERPPLTANQPEERRYRLRYRKNDEPLGEYSDIIIVTLGP